MKKLINTLLLAVACTFSAATTSFAQLDFSSDFVTDYVWRGFNVLGGKPAFQPSLTYTVGETGFGVNVWGSWSLTGRDNADTRNLDEIDLTISYDRSLTNTEVSLGFIHYDWFQNDDWLDEFTSTYEVYAGFTFSEVKYSPSVTIYYDLNSEGGDGMYVSLGAGTSWETDGGLTVDESFSIGYMDQSWADDAGISDVNYTISTSFGKTNMSMSPSFTFTYVPDDSIEPDFFIFWGGLSIGW